MLAIKSSQHQTCAVTALTVRYQLITLSWADKKGRQVL